MMQAWPIMHMNRLFRPSVGADLSRTPPMYRPSYAAPKAMKTGRRPDDP